MEGLQPGAAVKFSDGTVITHESEHHTQLPPLSPPGICQWLQPHAQLVALTQGAAQEWFSPTILMPPPHLCKTAQACSKTARQPMLTCRSRECPHMLTCHSMITPRCMLTQAHAESWAIMGAT